mmetsp:Transcript_15053/g.33988  ORF Transcript_15053/g.33988 Transcript_15053/m.33988 type:complete len:118 (-) Transcript_15053:13-366(-)
MSCYSYGWIGQSLSFLAGIVRLAHQKNEKERENSLLSLVLCHQSFFVDCFQSNTRKVNFEAPHVSLFALHKRLVSYSRDERQHFSCFLQTRCLSLPLVVIVFIDSLFASVRSVSPLP